MLQLPCPYCGTRDETEFTFGGSAHIQRPPLSASDTEWTNYLFVRDNPKGTHYERWCHGYGCGRWFNLARDTLTHEILRAYRSGEARPVLESERG